MTIEVVDFPIKNGGSFHSYVKLPEGNHEKWGIEPSKCVENQWFAMKFQKSWVFHETTGSVTTHFLEVKNREFLSIGMGLWSMGFSPSKTYYNLIGGLGWWWLMMVDDG